MVFYNYKNKQSGSVLLISLMMLIVLTLLTFSTSKSTLLQEKMTSSSRDNVLALEVAHAALLDAERSILDDPAFLPEGSSAGLYDGLNCSEAQPEPCAYLAALSDLNDEATWDKSSDATTSVSCGTADAGCSLTGKFIIVRLKLIDYNFNRRGLAIHSNVAEVDQILWENMYLYKVIAKGSGKGAGNTRILVSYYAARKSKNS